MKTEEKEKEVEVLESEVVENQDQSDDQAIQVMAETPYLGQTFDLSATADMLPDLHSGVELPLDLASGYWTPEQVGESKKVFFEKVETIQVLSSFSNPPVIVDLEHAFFVEQTEEGEFRSIRSASKVLVGIMTANKVRRGTPLKITYTGKRKNKSNAFDSSVWSVKPIIIKTIAI